MNQTTLITTLLAGAVALPVSSVVAQDVTFEMIPGAESANDMSPDGRYVVGSRFNDLYRYDTVSGEMLILPPPAYDAVAVSDDGSVILGSMSDEQGVSVAAIWYEDTNEWTSLGYLDTCGSGSSAYELSGDGTVATGLSWNTCSGRGFYWTEETGMLELQGLANGNCRSSVMSADGTRFGGFAQGSFSRTPAIWDDTLAGELLDPPNGDLLGEVHGMSDDGTQLLCEWDGDAAIVTDGGVEVLGMGSVYPGWTGIPMDIADDGTVVGFDIIQTLRIAWIQPQGMGMLQDLEVWIEANGGDVPDSIDLQVVQAVSSNGRKLIGHGAFTGAWLVTIAGDCPADTNDDGTVDVQDLVNVITAWGTDDANADVNTDGIVDVQDLVAIITAWGSC